MSSGAASKTAYAKQLVDFIQSSPSPFHTVETVSRLLLASGYKRISERNDDDFTIAPNGKYFFTRNQTTVFAFAVGGQYVPGNGLSIVAAHTDSPCLRVKPLSNISSAGIAQVGVQTYGGGLWHTWLDRDLSLAGRVMLRQGPKLSSHLVNIARPILFIPNLAIHLNREVNADGFKPNTETHLVPILATEIKAVLEKSEQQAAANHHPILLQCLADQLSCQVGDISDFELSLYATQAPCIGGALEEFVFAPRLDNLGMSFCSIRALIDADSSLPDDSNIRLVALFDHEEIGSQSAQGAASNMLHSTIRRLVGDKLDSALARSLLVSADMAHACHPNYSDKHEARHRPKIHGGVVIKHNANQRYATNSETACILKAIAGKHNLPLQEFVVRNDTGCGSTVGPILAANTGLRTIDIGVPQLSMHSIREVCGVDDIHHGVRLLHAFFECYPSVVSSLYP